MVQQNKLYLYMLISFIAHLPIFPRLSITSSWLTESKCREAVCRRELVNTKLTYCKRWTGTSTIIATKRDLSFFFFLGNEPEEIVYHIIIVNMHDYIYGEKRKSKTVQNIFWINLLVNSVNQNNTRQSVAAFCKQ